MNCIKWSRVLSKIWEERPEATLEDWLSQYSAELTGPDDAMDLYVWNISFATTEDMLVFKLIYNV